MCQSHWDKLRDALKVRGLYGMVAQDGAQAARDLADGRPDPLMAAHNAIVGNALDTAGLAVMTPNDDGSERCPLCYLKALSLAAPGCECSDPTCTPESRAERFERWIDCAADDQLARISGGGGKA
jgi:hypothetical protein